VIRGSRIYLVLTIQREKIDWKGGLRGRGGEAKIEGSLKVESRKRIWMRMEGGVDGKEQF